MPHALADSSATAAFSFKMFNQPAARPLVALLFIQFVSFALAQNETQSKRNDTNDLLPPFCRGSESKGYRHTCRIYTASSCGMIITTMIMTPIAVVGMTPISPPFHVYMAKLLVVIFVKYLFSNL